MRKKWSKELVSVEAIQSRPHIPIAVFRGSSYEHLARTLFPSHKIILLDSYDDFARYTPNAVLIRGEPQAISWSLRFPNFTTVIPTPSIGQESLSYAIAADADRFLCFLNPWLSLKKNESFTQQEYDLWILGKTESTSSHQPRWSIIRNVLHWID
jgi:hypothetical protein